MDKLVPTHVHLEQSLAKSGIGKGSESEGLGFNLYVALSRIIMSLISEDDGWIRDRRFGGWR